MTSDESRLQELERQFHSLDVRQTSLETYIKLYAAKTDEQMRLQREEMKEFKAETNARFDKMDAKIDKVQSDLSAQMHNLLVAGGIGFFTVVVTIFLTK